MSMTERLHTVAVYPPGDSHNRVLIPDLLTAAEDAPHLAVTYAAEAIAALSAVPVGKWRATVVASVEVEDAPSSTTNPAIQQ